MKINHKIITMSAGILTTILPLGSMAQVPLDGFYVNGQGGYVYLPDISGNGATITFNNNFTSFDFAGGIGYKSGPMRYEGQFNYIRSDLNQAKRNGVTVNLNGATNVYSLMGNLYFDFDMVNFPIVPYIGAGIGWAGLYTTNFNRSTSDSEFAYQGMGGLRYAFDDNFSFDLSYRYFATTNASKTFGDRYQANLINLGVTYNFG